MPSLYRYKGYTVEQVGLSHYIWRDFVSVGCLGPAVAGESVREPRGPHGYAQSKAEALRWINSDRGLMTPVESGWIEAIGYVPIPPATRQDLALPLHRVLTGFLIVRLKSGQTSAYLVPSWTYGAVMRSKSKGKAWHRLIKSHPEVPVPAGLITE